MLDNNWCQVWGLQSTVSVCDAALHEHCSKFRPTLSSGGRLAERCSSLPHVSWVWNTSRVIPRRVCTTLDRADQLSWKKRICFNLSSWAQKWKYLSPPHLCVKAPGVAHTIYWSPVRISTSEYLPSVAQTLIGRFCSQAVQHDGCLWSGVAVHRLYNMMAVSDQLFLFTGCTTWWLCCTLTVTNTYADHRIERQG
jgi:hypothetical protein